MGQTSDGQEPQAPPTAHREADPIDWRWALTQGGLTISLLVGAWSYRKDLQAAAARAVAHERAMVEAEIEYEKALADERQKTNEERLAFQQAKVDDAIRSNRALERLIDQTNVTLRASAAAMTEHAVVLARNTDSTHRLANAVERLGDERK
jgi:hypothetical protein